MMKRNLLYSSLFALISLFLINSVQAQAWTIASCSNLGSSTYGPMYSTATANSNNRIAVIYPSSQLASLANQSLTGVWYLRNSATGSMAGTPNFKVYLLETSNADWGTTALDWATAIASATLVFDGDPSTIVGTSAGWKQFPFTTSFLYSGTQNLAVLTEYYNPSTSSAISWNYEYTSPCISTTNSNTTKYNNNTTGTLATSLASSNYRRPLIGFEFAVSCAYPTNETAFNTGAYQTEFTWTENGTASQWEVQYGPSGFALGSGTSQIVSNDTVLISSLSPASTYNIYVRAICGAGDSSIWRGPITFNTPCAPIAPVFTEDFTTWTSTTTLPNCWEEYNDVTAATIAGSTANTTSAWTYDGFANNAASPFSVSATLGSASIELYNLGDHDWLVSPSIDLSGASGPYQVDFNWIISNWSTYVSEQIANDDYVALLVSNDNMQTWTELARYDSSTNFAVSATGQYVAYPLTAFAGDTVRFAFEGNEGTIDDAGDVKFFFDNFRVRPIPNCPQPVSLLGTPTFNGTDFDLTFTWTESGSAANWEIEYGLNNFTQGTGTVVSTTDTFLTVSGGFAPTTSYNFYVRSICGGGDTSIWNLTGNVVTPCAPFIPVYIQDFTTWTSTATLPPCWAEYDNVTPATFAGTAPSTSGSWIYDGFGNNASSPFSVNTTVGSASIELWDLGDNDWIVSPDINLTTGGPYQLDFNWLITYWNSFTQAQISDDDFVALLITTDGGTTWTELDRWDSSTVVVPTLTGVSSVYNLSAYSGQIVKFGFWGSEAVYNDLSDIKFFFDNFRVRNIPTCPEPTNLGVDYVSNNTARLSWTNGNTETEWLVEYGAPGFTLGSGTQVVASSNPFVVTGLVAETNYEFYISAVCGPGDTSVASYTASATTLCDPVSLPYLYDVESASTTTNSSIADCWSSSPSVTTSLYRWDVDGAGSTPTTLTGPDAAHSGVKYFYTEGSSGAAGDSAFLYTPIVDLSSSTYPRISFWYHMYGQTMGDLAVQINNGTGWQTLQTISGEQQSTYTDPWLQSQVQLFSFAGDTVQIRFAGIRGSNGYCDMSLDDILIEETPLNDVGVTAILSPITGCGDANDLILVELTNSGALTQYNVPVYAELSGDFVGTYTSTVDSILPGQTLEVVIDTLDTQLGGIINNTSYTLLSGDNNTANDTLSLNGESLETLPLPLNIMDMSICFGDSAMFYNSGTANVRWYLASNDSLLTEEDTLWVNPTMTTQYAVETFNKASETFGPNNAPTTGFSPTTNYYGERFIANEDFLLQSVVIYPNGTGNILVELYDDATDTVIYSLTAAVTDGGTAYSPFTLDLNFEITASTSTYRLVYVSGLGVTNLGRSTTGGAFPYSTAGGEVVLTQSSTTLTGGTTTTIYFFYDWTVELNSCSSSKTYFNTVVNQAEFDTLNPVVCNGMTINGNFEDTSGVFYETYISNTTGCDSTLVYNLTVNYPSTSTITDVFCENSSYTLADGTSVSSAGTHTAVIMNNAGCDSTITYNLSTLPLASSNQSVALCFGESIVIGGNTYDTTGVYTDIFTAANGCDSILTTTLTINDLPQLNVSGLQPIFEDCDDAVTLNLDPIGGTLSGNGIIGTSFDPSTAGVGTHTITYSYTNDTTGCSSSFSVDVEVTVCTAINGITGIETFTVYPNPFANNIKLSFNDNTSDKLSIKLYDIKGSLITAKDVVTNIGANTFNLNVNENVASGVAVLEISRNGATQTIQLIKK